MNLPLYLARRLSLGSDGRRAAPAVKIATAAVALSVAVMMTSLAVVFGFKKEITARVTGFNPHITLQNNRQVYPDDPLLSLTPELTDILDSIPWINDYALTSAAPVIIKTPGDFKGLYLRSGDGMQDFLSDQTERGVMPDFRHDTASLAISASVASRLCLEEGDRADVYFLTDNVRVRKMRVSAIFNSHFDTYDDIYAFASLPVIQEMAGTGKGRGTQIAISVDDFDNVDNYARELESLLCSAYDNGRIFRFLTVDTALDSGANFFGWLNLLDMNVIVIIVIMAAVASVTLVSGMLIIIVDKKRFIALMRAMGAPGHMMRSTFVWLALTVAATGLAAGDAISLLLIWCQKKTHFIPLDADSYYIDFVPAELNWTAIVMLNAGVLMLAWAVLVVPAGLAKKI